MLCFKYNNIHSYKHKVRETHSHTTHLHISTNIIHTYIHIDGWIDGWMVRYMYKCALLHYTYSQSYWRWTALFFHNEHGLLNHILSFFLSFLSFFFVILFFSYSFSANIFCVLPSFWTPSFGYELTWRFYYIDQRALYTSLLFPYFILTKFIYFFLFFLFCSLVHCS